MAIHLAQLFQPERLSDCIGMPYCTYFLMYLDSGIQTTFPGLRMSLGSKARLIRRMSAMAVSPYAFAI